MKHSYSLALLLTTAAILGDDLSPEYYSGGSTTVFVENNKAFSRPLANLSGKTLRHHSIGNSFFNQNWIEAPASASNRDGLGPLFNARSCSTCHPNDGKGRPIMKGVNKLGMVTRISIPGLSEVGGPLPDPTYGGQLADFALPGLQPEAKIHLSFKDQRYEIAGQSFMLRTPQLRVSDLSSGPFRDDLMFSNRLAPAVHGMGLIDEIADETLLAFADPDDRDHDGISGRPNLVWDYERKTESIGRFGWKASQPTLKQQIADAFLNDIGITSSIHPSEALSNHQLMNLKEKIFTEEGPEASDKVIDRVRTYLATLAPPARRDLEKPSVIRGKVLFEKFQCAKCHIPEMTTRSEASIPELANQTIRPYSDFLLHDMGPGLADNRPDFRATGREWRTPPLWGIGLQHIVSRHSFFLHDGRAQNVVEAILWHGGEAATSRDFFVKSTQQEKHDLFDFLNSF